METDVLTLTPRKSTDDYIKEIKLLTVKINYDNDVKNVELKVNRALAKSKKIMEKT